MSSSGLQRGKIVPSSVSACACFGGCVQLWYTLVHTNQSNSGSADSENHRVVNSAYELRIHACIRLSQFSEFSRPVRIPYWSSRLSAKPARTPIERGLDPFLSTSYRCNDGRCFRQIAHGRIRVYIGKGSKNSLTWSSRFPTYKFT